MIIVAVLNALREGDQTPDMLEIDILAEQDGIDSATDEPTTVTQAEFLYSVAVVCLKTVRRIAGHLNKVGWTREDVELFSRTFENLADAWSTYKRILFVTSIMPAGAVSHRRIGSWQVLSVHGASSSPNLTPTVSAACRAEILDRATGLTTSA